MGISRVYAGFTFRPTYSQVGNWVDLDFIALVLAVSKQFQQQCVLDKNLNWGGIMMMSLSFGHLPWLFALATNIALVGCSKDLKCTANRCCTKMPPLRSRCHRCTTTKCWTNVELSGRTSAYQISEVRPQTGGVILKRLFAEGSYVQTGQALMKLMPIPIVQLLIVLVRPYCVSKQI